MATKPKTKKQTIRFFHDGRPMPDSQNSISSLAYYFTRDIEGEAPRISTAALVDILTKESGKSDLRSSSWDVTLPNGVALAARVAGDKTPVAKPTAAAKSASASKPVRSAAKTPAKKSTTKTTSTAKRSRPPERLLPPNKRQVNPIPKKGQGAKKQAASTRSR